MKDMIILVALFMIGCGKEVAYNPVSPGEEAPFDCVVACKGTPTGGGTPVDTNPKQLEIKLGADTEEESCAKVKLKGSTGYLDLGCGDLPEAPYYVNSKLKEVGDCQELKFKLVGNEGYGCVEITATDGTPLEIIEQSNGKLQLCVSN